MTTNGPDVIDCLLQDHESIKNVLASLQSRNIEIRRRRAIFKRFLPLFNAHTYGEEQSVLTEGLKYESLRPKVLEALEEHDITEIEVNRINLAADDGIWEARVKVFCETLEHHLAEEEEKTFPAMKAEFNQDLREGLGMRYLEARKIYDLNPIIKLTEKPAVAMDQAGKAGYAIAWLLGVPFWLLLLVFLIRG